MDVADVIRRVRAVGRRRQTRELATPDIMHTLTDLEQEIVGRAAPHTMTSPSRLVAAIDAVDYVVQRGIPGALVECGVWRGGTVLAMVLRLQSLGVTDREVYLYDTFEGMTEPTSLDTSTFDEPALLGWKRAQATGQTAWDWVFGPEAFNVESVKELLFSSGYPRERLHFVVGPVEDTIPGTMPDQIALLRLDTDWYESTRHELVHLYPRLVDGGALIIDDYGHWHGCRKAVDEYFEREGRPLLMSRVDYTGRMAVKH